MFTSLQVFDDGDERTLRRTSLCLKGGRHFNESEVSIKFILQHVYFGVASLTRNWTRTWFSLQYIVFILFLDPWPSSPYRSWKFWYPGCAGKQYLTNPVWHVLSMLYLFLFCHNLFTVEQVTWQQYQCLHHYLEMQAYCFMYLVLVWP